MSTEIYAEQKVLIKIKPILQKLAIWVTEKLNLPVETLNVIITDDEYLKKMHAQYLDDDSYTDVMTFDLGEPDRIEGEIYISLDRAMEQSADNRVSLPEELSRLVIHGILHLAGQDDREPADRKKMKKREDDLLFETTKLFLNNTEEIA
jgi:probable rRNA maturation factor